MKILVTGSSGFVGSSLVPKLAQKYTIETVSLRRGDINEINFKGINKIIHLAGKAHQMQPIDDKIYFDINCDLTLKLAKRAKNKRVAQFIFISTTKVYGEENIGGKVWDEYAECKPSDAYGASKLKAEQQLKEIETDEFKITIIRPPLIYGDKVKGNLRKLTKLIRKAPFLPFAGINNQRSMVYVGNLIALIDHLIKYPKSGIFIAGDSQPYSTTELIEMIKINLGVSTILVKMPMFILNFLRKFKPNLINRLYGSYIIDNSKTNTKLSFEPPYSFKEGIREMVQSDKK